MNRYQQWKGSIVRPSIAFTIAYWSTVVTSEKKNVEKKVAPQGPASRGLGPSTDWQATGIDGQFLKIAFFFFLSWTTILIWGKYASTFSTFRFALARPAVFYQHTRVSI